MNKEKRISFFIFSLIAIVVAVALLAYFFAIPELVNIESRRSQIIQGFKKQTGLPVEFGQLRTSMTPTLGIRIHFKSIKILHKDRKPFISTGPAYVEIFLPSLLRKEILIRKIWIKNPTAYIARLSNGKFDIEQFIPKRKKKPEEYRVRFRNSRIIVNDYTIFFKDQYVEPDVSYTFSGEKIVVSDLDPDKYFSVTAKGQVLAPQKPNTFFDITYSSELPFNFRAPLKNKLMAQGTINNLYPNMFLTYLNNFTPYNFSSIQGKADISFNIKHWKSSFTPNRISVQANIKDLYLNNNRHRTIASFPGMNKILFTGGDRGEDFRIDVASLISDKVKADISGSISNFRSKKRIFDLRVRIAKSRIENVISMFPQGLNLPVDPVGKLQKYNLKGNVWGNAEIRGQAKYPDLSGNISFNDFTVIVDSVSIPKGFGTVRFKGKSININTKLYTDPVGYIITTGTVLPSQERLNLSVKSNPIDLNIAHSLVLALQDIFEFETGPLNKMNISGKGKVNLNIKGPFSKVSLHGFLDSINSSVRYHGLSKTVHDITGRLKFLGDRVSYNGITGLMDVSRISAYGYSTLKGFTNVKLVSPNISLVTARELIVDSPELAKVQESLRDITNISGYAAMVLYITGDSNSIASKGRFFFKNASLSYAGFSQPVKNLYGLLAFQGDTVIFNELKGIIAQSSITANGEFTDGNYVSIILTSPRLNLSAVKNLVMTSPALAAAQEALRGFRSLSGYAGARFALAGKSSEDIFQNARFRIINASFVHQDIGFPIQLLRGILTVTPDEISTRQIGANIFGAPATIAGRITRAGQEFVPNLSINVQRFPFARVRDLAGSPLAHPDASRLIADFRNLQGRFNANIKVSAQSYDANIQVHGLRAYYEPMKLPVAVNFGNIRVTPSNISLKTVYARLSRSSVYLNGRINSYNTRPILDLLTSARINSQDIDEYINPCLDDPIQATGIIPIRAIIKGHTEKWNVLAQMTLEKGVNILYKGNIGLSSDRIRVFSLNAQGNTDRIDIKNFEIAVGDDPVRLGTSAVVAQVDTTAMEKLLEARGIIDDVKTAPVFNDFFLASPNPIDITILNPVLENNITTEEEFFSRGKLKMEALLNGNISDPRVVGEIFLDDVAIPSKETIINCACVDFNENEILLRDSLISIANSRMKLTGIAENRFTTPFTVRQISIISPSLNVDRIVAVFRPPPSEEIEETEETVPPIIVNQGFLQADELIISDIITTNAVSNFTLTPDWLLTFPNLSLQVANGTATGEVIYNLNNNVTYGKLVASDMQANAAATIFLSLPNEVFGTLNGSIEFQTRGTTREELLGNANGVTSFVIRDGRLTRLGSIEYLLNAANIVMAGLTGINLNAIINLVIPYRTGNFDTLDGTITAENGVLSTDDILMEGRNLDLALTGNMNLVTEYADITIIGRLSRRVAGVLGPLGSISINTFIGFIPGLGFLPGGEGLLSYIPGLNLIPGLGLGQRGRDRVFAVEIEGNITDPNAVRSFRWLDEE